jgi:hypothetical protein
MHRHDGGGAVPGPTSGPGTDRVPNIGGRIQMKTSYIITAAAWLLITASAFGPTGSGAAPLPMDHPAKSGTAAPDTMKAPDFQNLPGYGKKCWIGDSLYFTYKFAKKPKMGTAILIVQLFDKQDKRLTNLRILGNSDMPAMRGAHDSGEIPFKLNKKGDYLLPVNVVMPGRWEVKLIFLKGNKAIFRGGFAFEV